MIKNLADKWLVSSRLMLIVFALYVFGSPIWILISAIGNPDFQDDQIPPMAFELHEQLSPRYAKWAQNRLSDTASQDVNYLNVSGTEWPLFGSMFFLLATESLEAEWQTNPVTVDPPSVYASEAVESSIQLILDPNHAAWVIEHWGDNYMSGDSAFYRMMRVGSMTAYTNITGNQQYMGMLREETIALATDIDHSPIGLLDDYLGECYPSDVMMACLTIQNADTLLGTDHSEMIQRALRGFTVDSGESIAIPPFRSYRNTGKAWDVVRGSSNSHVALGAPYLWPEQAKQWYGLHEEHFWRTRLGFSGFLEFEEKDAVDWYFDVDSGPIISGLGFTACAFGVGASRANGRYDHAYPLMLEMLATSWPLANGVLMVPRLLSDSTDAPYTGEAAIIYNMTRRTAPGITITKASDAPVPPYVYILLLLYSFGGLVVISTSLWDIRRVQRKQEYTMLFPPVQFLIALSAIGMAIYFWQDSLATKSLFSVLLATAFPLVRMKKPPKEAA